MIRINQIKIPVEAKQQESLDKKIAKIIKSNDFQMKRIVKKSIDARDKTQLMYIYAVDISCKNEKAVLKANRNNNNIMLTDDKKYKFPLLATEFKGLPPVIIGAGPAGYFCGLYLARAGFHPIIIERGKDVDARGRDVCDFWSGGKIDPESNVSFGEGGAGTFSDGKLNTGIKDPMGRIEAFIADFISFGAPEEIAYLNKPHVGTDELKNVMKNMRNEIIECGGEIRFESRFTGYKRNPDNTLHVMISDGRTSYQITTSALVLAIGHSSRDTFEMLHEMEVPMEAKSFAMGLRIEHPREVIQAGQYGTSEAAAGLPAADYKMTFRSSAGRSVYSFCMCPGGFVVNASTDDGQSVVNGMSYHARDARNSNSAIVVNVTPDDFANAGYSGILAGMHFQQYYEEKAYIEGKGNIPVQRFEDYEAGRTTGSFGHITPEMKGSYSLANLNNCLPSYINNAIIEAIHYYDKKLAHFADGDAVLSGIESRTSSPVRILRDEQLMSNVTGLFPCGEGAGYAGGITSAAVDGIKVAEAVASYLTAQP
ncbi:MAG: NAD(P)/FAD-dependent oxidoreductase [Wujia sp.]